MGSHAAVAASKLVNQEKDKEHLKHKNNYKKRFFHITLNQHHVRMCVRWKFQPKGQFQK